jgi:hypothetical protein
LLDPKRTDMGVDGQEITTAAAAMWEWEAKEAKGVGYVGSIMLSLVPFQCRGSGFQKFFFLETSVLMKRNIMRLNVPSINRHQPPVLSEI